MNVKIYRQDTLTSCRLPLRIIYYYCGLKEWDYENGYLLDTCLTAQDRYKAYLDYFRISKGQSQKKDSHGRYATASLTGTSLCTYAIAPPCTERHARWYERTATQLMGSLLLDFVSMQNWLLCYRGAQILVPVEASNVGRMYILLLF